MNGLQNDCKRCRMAKMTEPRVHTLVKSDLCKGAPSLSVMMNAGEIFGMNFVKEADKLGSQLSLLRDISLDCKDEMRNQAWPGSNS